MERHGPSALSGGVMMASFPHTTAPKRVQTRVLLADDCHPPPHRCAGGGESASCEMS